MILFNIRPHSVPPSSRSWRLALVLPGVLVIAFGLAGHAQQPVPANPAPQPAQPDTQQQPAAADTTPAAADTATGDTTRGAGQAAPSPEQAAPTQTATEAQMPGAAPLAISGETPGGITEDQLRQMLVGKDLYLRGGYLGDLVAFNEHGRLNGHAPYGSYTLCGVRIEKVRLTRHKAELTGARYGLHFLGALPYEDPTKAMDRVKITAKKKVLRLTIDREIVVKAKKEKEAKPQKGAAAKAGKGAPAKENTSAEAEPKEMSEADQLKAEIAAAPEAERPAEPGSVTTTTSPAHATKVLMEALNNVFATGIDDRMMAEMPKFWRLYYQAAAARTDYRPADPEVLRQNMVDQKAKLLTSFEPESNEYAQANGVAGMALYHVVIGADGKPGEIAVARPIGFGLDENAVESIRKAGFQAAVKDGKAVPVLLDLVVQFRIYSKRTAVSGVSESSDKAGSPALPGPYTVAHP